ncbi:MAG: hypothetical protein EBS41_05600 [Actinobacteria bacterium]|nr:hypothetical protein [Actinomycetota bacterium]
MRSVKIATSTSANRGVASPMIIAMHPHMVSHLSGSAPEMVSCDAARSGSPTKVAFQRHGVLRDCFT